MNDGKTYLFRKVGWVAFFDPSLLTNGIIDGLNGATHPTILNVFIKVMKKLFSLEILE